MQVKPLFLVETSVESHSHSRIEYTVKAKSQFKSRSSANNVQIEIPVPVRFCLMRVVVYRCVWIMDVCGYVVW